MTLTKAAQDVLAERPECDWSEEPDFSGRWYTCAGATFCDPKIEEFAFCPYCGGRLILAEIERLDRA